MHVAQNLISLTFDSTEISSIETLSAEVSEIAPDAFNFAAMLQTNIGESGGQAGEVLPLNGSELPLSPEVDSVEVLPTTGGSLVEDSAPIAEIVASMQVAPAIVQTQSITLPADAQSIRVTAPKLAESPLNGPLPHTVKIDNLTIANRVELPTPMPVQPQQAGAEIVATVAPAVGAALRPNELLGLKLEPGNLGPRRDTVATPLSTVGIVDDLPLMPEPANNRISTPTVTTTIASGLDAALDVNSRQPGQATPQNISIGAAPAPLIQATSVERPATPPAFEMMTTTIATPVRDTAWGDRISQQVLTMATSKMQVAEIRLTPAELGPLKVQIDVDDGLANVAFQSQHAATREAIELALPRLRELLAENGLTLGQSDVSEREEAQREQSPGDRANADARSADDKEGAGSAEQPASTTLRSQQNLLDAFV